MDILAYLKRDELINGLCELKCGCKRNECHREKDKHYYNTCETVWFAEHQPMFICGKCGEMIEIQ